MKILLATNNLHKAGEFRRMFASSGLGAELITIKESGFAGEINESAETFEGNAYIKARTLCDYSGLITIADDSGLCVDALGGAPGV
ncbi:MAG: non-canonical purine NTP pyrophosphatase, partial [Clostridia bacterium]|nr:non-canonical purine NTP pyrophosphatase [Clostridia bacterium]